MSSSAPPPLAVVAVTMELEETTDVDDDSQWEEESEDDDDDNQWEESEEDEGSAGASADVAAVGAEIDAWPTCCVCMEPWTSDGAHRICCIPCGHVYGRSCLEKWLRRCGNTSAKCPQCRQRFEHKHITNLHVSGHLWDDLYRLKTLAPQGLEARLISHIDKAVESRFGSIQQSCWQEAARDAAAAAQAEFLSMKEQMRQMADQHNATPADLLRFMEHNGAKLREAILSRPPPAARPACNGGTN